MNKLIEIIFEFVLSFLGSKPAEAAETQAPPSPPADADTIPAPIDWANPNCKVSKYFSVKEAITLHSWDRLATEADGLTEDVKQQIIKLCNILDEVREYLNSSMIVHCIFRSQQYNQEILHSFPNDPHSRGQAIDFDCGKNLSINEIHTKMEPVLERYGLRMERNTPTWVHLDISPVIHSRYFLA